MFYCDGEKLGTGKRFTGKYFEIVHYAEYANREKKRKMRERTQLVNAYTAYELVRRQFKRNIFLR
jgi:hypothetical protein